MSEQNREEGYFYIDEMPEIHFKSFSSGECTTSTNAVWDKQKYRLEMHFDFNANEATRIAVVKIFKKRLKKPEEEYSVFRDFPESINSCKLPFVMENLPILLGQFSGMTPAFVLLYEQAKTRFWESAEREKNCC